MMGGFQEDLTLDSLTSYIIKISLPDQNLNTFLSPLSPKNVLFLLFIFGGTARANECHTFSVSRHWETAVHGVGLPPAARQRDCATLKLEVGNLSLNSPKEHFSFWQECPVDVFFVYFFFVCLF